MTAILLMSRCCKCFCQCVATSVTSACRDSCLFGTWPFVKDQVILPKLGKIPLILTAIPLHWMQGWGLQSVMSSKELRVRVFSSLGCHVFLQWVTSLVQRVSFVFDIPIFEGYVYILPLYKQEHFSPNRDFLHVECMNTMPFTTSDTT